MADASALKFPVNLSETECCVCGIKFAAPTAYLDKKRQDHSGFRCPNGHSLKWSGESDLDIINRYGEALRRIAAIETGIFNKASLELAIEIANGALK